MVPHRNPGSYVILIWMKPGEASSWFLTHFFDFAHTLNPKLTKWSRFTWPKLKFDWLFCSSVCHANTVYLSVLFSLIANSWPEDLPQHLLFNWLAAFTLSTKIFCITTVKNRDVLQFSIVWKSDHYNIQKVNI